MLPRLYRKRPVVIEAVKFEPGNANVAEVIDFLRTGKVHHLVKSIGIVIRTPEGDMLASPGDYIIRGVAKEFYPMKPAAFEAAYEALL